MHNVWHAGHMISHAHQISSVALPSFTILRVYVFRKIDVRSVVNTPMSSK